MMYEEGVSVPTESDLQIVDCFFVYGTLLRGECRRYLIEKLQGVSLGQATTNGWLIDLGDYPGLVDEAWLNVVAATVERPTSKKVLGELVQFPDLESARNRLDEEEGCLVADFGLQGPGIPFRVAAKLGAGLYIRRLAQVHVPELGNRWAWTYVYNQPVSTIRWIPSGSWLRRERLE